MVNFNKLYYFYIACKFKSLTDAANSLHISQPALSKAIKDLESDFGAKLFEQDGRTLSLTHAGHVLKDESADLFLKGELLEKNMKDAISNEISTIHFGYMIYEEIFNVIPFLKKINVSKSLSVEAKHEQSRSNITADLLENKLDVGLKLFTLDDISPELNYYTLKESPLAVLTRTDNPIASRKIISMSELKDESFVQLGTDSNSVEYKTVLDWCNRCGFEPKVSFKEEWVGNVLLMVQSGAGISILSDHSPIHQMNGLTLVPLYNAPMIYSGLFWRKSDLRSSIQDFLNLYIENRKNMMNNANHF